jgi:hypothetical protein
LLAGYAGTKDVFVGYSGQISSTQGGSILIYETYEAMLEWRVDEVGRSSLSGRILLRTSSVPRVLDQLRPGGVNPASVLLQLPYYHVRALWLCHSLVMVARVGGLLLRDELDDLLFACSDIGRTLLLTHLFYHITNLLNSRSSVWFYGGTTTI